MSLTTIRRGALVLLLDAAILLLLSAALDGFVLDGAATALAAAALVGLLNAFVWPLLVRVALPLTVLTLGVAALVLNALLVMFAIDLLPGAEVAGLWDGIVITVVVRRAVTYSLRPALLALVCGLAFVPALFTMSLPGGVAAWVAGAVVYVFLLDRFGIVTRADLWALRRAVRPAPSPG